MRIAVLLSSLLLALPAFALAARAPVVVELYTAQGCGSCGEANGLVAKLAERPGVLVLTLPVDYWDYLGWVDTFAKPEFAERQKAYVTRLELREPYTPQVVVNGRGQAPGQKPLEVEALVRDAKALPQPDIRFLGKRRVDVGSGRRLKTPADVWLIRYDPRAQEVAVKSGDNRGQSIPHKNVVREITRLGAWRGAAAAYRLPEAAEDGLKSVVIVQQPQGGAVIGVGEAKP
jgi:hypothetical protein